jgi:tRNA(fMet)-specific endonuclease VapC
MKPVVLDTNVVSFLFKSDSRAQAYLPHLRDRQWLISFMTEAELEQWRFWRTGMPSELIG